MDVEVRLQELRIDGNSVRFPYTISSWVAVENGVILTVESFKIPREDWDISLPSDEQNLLRIDNSGEYIWVVEGSGIHTQDQPTYFTAVFELQGRLLGRHENGYTYQIDRKSGRILRDWPNTELPIGGTVVSLDGPHQVVLEREDGIFVRCRDSDTVLYAFTHDGTERWRAEERRGMLYDVDGMLVEKVKASRRQTDWYRLDSATGDRIEEIEQP